MKHLKTALTRIRRSPYQAFAAVSIMTMTLFLAGVFALLAAGSQAVLKHFETRPQINAYFKQEYVPQPQEIERIKSQLQSTGKVDSVTYITKEEALKIYKDMNNSDPLLLEAVTANMLPASIEVSAKDPSFLGEISNQLKGESGISDVQFAEEIVGILTRWTNSVRIIGISLVGFNVLITFTIILLIISIKVANRRDEISTLQLLGATSSYIGAPFIYEGILYGIFGAVIAWGTIYLLLLYTMGFWVSFLHGIPILPPPVLFMFELLGAEIFLGAFVGGLGGISASQRFLKT